MRSWSGTLLAFWAWRAQPKLSFRVSQAPNLGAPPGHENADPATVRQRSRHGFILKKAFGEQTRIAVIPDKPLVQDTLSRILSMKQTGVGREHLPQLIETHGLS